MAGPALSLPEREEIGRALTPTRPLRGRAWPGSSSGSRPRSPAKSPATAAGNSTDPLSQTGELADALGAPGKVSCMPRARSVGRPGQRDPRRRSIPRTG